MKLQIQKATTDVSVYLFIQNSSSTTGAGLTGLVFNSSGLVAYYVRPLGNATQLTLATQTVTGAHSDGGFVEVDATNMPGVYRLDLSDAICATGVNSVVVMLKGATNMAPIVLEIQLVSYNPNDAVRLGLTALPNAAADAAGGLPISDAGGLDLDARIGTDIPAILVDTGTTLPAEVDGIQADTEDIQSRLPAALVGGRIDANMGAVSTDATAADTLELFAEALDQATGQLDAGSFASGAFDAVWTVATRTLTSFGTLVADVATAVWAAGTRTLTSLSGVAADIRAAVGLASANLDTQLDALPITAEVNAEVDTALADAGVTSARMAKLDNLPEGVKKNTALADFEFLMVDSSDNELTGLTVTAQRSIDGGAFGACTNSPTEVGNGIYKIDLSAADLNGDVVTFRFSEATAKDTFITVKTSV